MKLTFITGVIALLFQTTDALKINDLDVLTGKKWTGTLTYLDYGTGKPETIATELIVTAKGNGIYTWATSYPKELSHNSTDEVVVSKDGRVFDGETVKERKLLNDGTLEFITQSEGNDNNKKALFRITYLITKTTFTRKKEVCYVGGTVWFTRNHLSLKSN